MYLLGMGMKPDGTTFAEGYLYDYIITPLPSINFFNIEENYAEPQSLPNHADLARNVTFSHPNNSRVPEYGGALSGRMYYPWKKVPDYGGALSGKYYQVPW